MPAPELILHNGTVLTMDAGATIHPRGHVIVRHGTITAVGPGDPPARQGQCLDAQGGLILPGLVNAHTHAAMTLFRGLADDLPLMEWLENYIFPVEARLDPDSVHTGARLACAEMIRSGTTCFADMYLFAHEVARAAHDCGLRAVVGEVLYDFPSPSYGPLEAGFACTRRLIEAWRDDPLISVAVQPHALYTCAPDLLREAGRMARRYGVPLILHLCETRSETRQIVERYGLRPVAHLDRLGLLDANLIADHAIWLTPEEIDLLARRGVRVAHCAESNMKLASGVAPVPELLAAGVAVGLGTDGCASNNDLDLFGEMDTVAKLHKVHRLDPTVLGAETVLHLATMGGARVLGVADRIGSLEPGKRADIIVVDTRQPHLTPLYHPVSHLVYAARGADVRHTVIDGRVVMRDRRLLTIDLEELLEKVRAKADRVRSWLPARK